MSTMMQTRCLSIMSNIRFRQHITQVTTKVHTLGTRPDAPKPSDYIVTADSIFSGITTFAKLPWVQCLGKDRDAKFDIAFIGAPFVSLSYTQSRFTLLM